MCPEHEILSAYFDGEILSPWDKYVKNHILSCKVCTDKIESFKKLKDNLLEDSEPDYSLPMQRVWDKIIKTKKNIYQFKKSIWQRNISIPVPFIAIAATLIICIGFLLIFDTVKHDPSSVNIVTHKEDGSMTEVNITAKDAEEIEALLKALEDNNAPNEVIIRLPEGSKEFQIGEPELIRAIDFKRNDNR